MIVTELPKACELMNIEVDSSHYSPLKKTFPKIGTERSERRGKIGFLTERTRRVRQQKEQTERDHDVLHAGEER